MADSSQTEIGNFPPPWNIERIDSLFDIQQGKSVSKKHRDGGNQRPFLRTKNVLWGKLDLAELDKMHFSDQEEERLELRVGDLLLCEGGDVGRTAIWNDELRHCYYQNHLHRLRVKDPREVDPLFALYWFWFAFAVGGIYIGRSNVTTIPNLSQSKLGELQVAKPGIVEQQRIARVLSVVQRAIETQSRLAALTREARSSVFNKLFSEGLNATGNRASEIGLVPDSWNVSRLLEFCVLQRGFDITKKQQKAGPVPVVSSGGVSSFHSVAKVKGPGVIVGRKGSLGTVHYVDVDFWPHDTTLWVSDFKGNDPMFTAYFLENLHLERFDSGASNPTLNRNTVHAEIVAYPKPEEQIEIGRILRQFDAKIQLHEQSRAQLEELFRNILAQLMTAQLRLERPVLETAD